MDTTTILAFRHPSQVDLLLESLVTTMGWVSAQSSKSQQRSDLPSSLQRLAMSAERSNQRWVVWFHQGVPRLYVTRVATDYARSIRLPSLAVTIYNDRGALRHQGLWVQHRDGNWKCREMKPAPAEPDKPRLNTPTQRSKSTPWFYRRS